MWCVGPCCVMNNSWIVLSAFCKQWAPELHCHTTHVDLCFFLFHQEVLSVAHKACWDKHKIFPACRIFCARISLAIRCIHVVLWPQNLDLFWGPKQHWTTCFIQTQHFLNLQTYCLLTPLMSPTDTEYHLIDGLVKRPPSQHGRHQQQLSLLGNDVIHTASGSAPFARSSIDCAWFSSAFMVNDQRCCDKLLWMMLLP